MPRRISRSGQVQPSATRHARRVRLPVRIGIVAALAAAALAAAATSTRASTAHARQAASVARGVRQLPTLEERVLDAINQIRVANGLVPLSPSPALAEEARQHTLSMVEHGFFAHTSLDGAPFWKRVARTFLRKGWSVGENLVWASPALSARQAIEMWLASPEHRANLLAPAWRQVGVGAVHAAVAPGVYEGRAATILTADFGVRR